MLTYDLITERLIIKSTREEHGPLCLSIWLDDEMGKYLGDPPRDKANEKYMNFAKGIEEDEGWYPFVVFSKDSNEFIGTCSMVPMEDMKHWDLGYCIHKKYWRQGYATEMIKALISFGYDKGGRRFTADVAQENIASNAVIKKLGFTIQKEGSFRKQGTNIVYDDYTYELHLE
ncbi:MAG: GNAT family N-acetyltransferase [Niameybacter sp.]|uniref:GNAT family N-acetyltransferase n=1 Tax=Niameybacter sp. TaxID=2033640 RepID=UPI002FCC3355